MLSRLVAPLTPWHMASVPAVSPVAVTKLQRALEQVAFVPSVQKSLHANQGPVVGAFVHFGYRAHRRHPATPPPSPRRCPGTSKISLPCSAPCVSKPEMTDFPQVNSVMCVFLNPDGYEVPWTASFLQVCPPQPHIVYRSIRRPGVTNKLGASLLVRDLPPPTTPIIISINHNRGGCILPPQTRPQSQFYWTYHDQSLITLNSTGMLLFSLGGTERRL